MTKFVLRHWRGDGQIIPDVMREAYQDHPKHRKVRPYKLSECLYKVLTEAEYLGEVLKKRGVVEHNKAIYKYRLNVNKLILKQPDENI